MVFMVTPTLFASFAENPALLLCNLLCITDLFHRKYTLCLLQHGIRSSYEEGVPVCRAAFLPAVPERGRTKGLRTQPATAQSESEQPGADGAYAVWRDERLSYSPRTYRV